MPRMMHAYSEEGARNPQTRDVRGRPCECESGDLVQSWEGLTCEGVSELRGSDRGSTENVNRARDHTWPMLLVRTLMRRMTMRDVVVQECESVCMDRTRTRAQA